MPDFAHELEAGGIVAGVDEAGRGPLAGPVVAAAVVFLGVVPRGLLDLIDDSKKLDAGQRARAYLALRAGGVAIGIGAASVGEIFRLNILRATMLAMARAVARLPSVPDLALVDGNVPPSLPCAVRCVVDGDARSFSIAAASIIAKVTRDRAMARLHARYPDFNWAGNAGYATADHRAALRRLGPCAHHRAAFGTVRQILSVPR